ncbi:hypothetical protein NQZ68_013856 [Dissostichus eleginoides]|nr:hypothetical protein NQZ68_013856 [Dissostichus eleginoides]
MMFDHGMGAPLGLHRKPSRVESAKKLWRVIPGEVRTLMKLDACLGVRPKCYTGCLEPQLEPVN